MTMKHYLQFQNKKWKEVINRMAESYTTKNITTVEEVNELEITDKVFVNDSDSLKQISLPNLMDSSGALKKNQGAENSGKSLIVGEDGNVVLGEKPIKVDSTLSQSGYGADAKATGDRISALSIHQTVSGESLQIEDSADTPMAGLRVFGKSRQVKTTGAQLFDASKIPTKTQGGATVTNNGDGSFTVTGNGTVSELFVVNYDITGDIAKSFFKAGRVKTALSNVRPYFYFSFRHSGGIYGDVDSKSYTNFDLTDEMINSDGFYVRCGFQLPQGNEIVNGTIKPMVYQDGDGTWEPYTGGKPSPSPDYPHEIEVPGSEGNVGVNVTGAQLLDLRNGKSGTGQGVTYTNRGDGTYTRVGTPTHISGNVGFLGGYGLDPEVENNVLLTLEPGTYYIRDVLLFSNTQSISSDYNNGIITIDSEFKVTGIRNPDQSVGVTYNDIIYPMIAKSSSALPWEPYHTPQKLTVQTPNGLPGVPVESGGNYTDSDGRQWVCDEVDFDRGKYVQRVKKVTNLTFTKAKFGGELEDSNLYATSRINDMYATNNYPPAICSNLIYDKNVLATEMDAFYIYDKVIRARLKGIKDDEVAAATLKTYTFIYPLATPIETDLSEEELTAYAALRTNYPTTVVTSDSDPEVGIEVEYVADTQKYIDNKFAELAQNLAATQNTLLEV